MRFAWPSIVAAMAMTLLSAPADAGPPSAPSVDAPQLAALGPFGVGFDSLDLVNPAQPDPLARPDAAGALPRADRRLPTDVWFPARAPTSGRRVTYAGALSGEDGKDVAFTATGLARRGARAAAGSFPLAILAHGYGGTPAAMTWLAENLASKGYVVVAPHFRDPAYGDISGFAGPLARRPVDIAFVTAKAQAMARARKGVLMSADADRTVLIGYSMGGYGVLTAAGAPLSPVLGPLTRGALAPFTAGAARAGELRAAGVVAVVVISPAGLFAGRSVWAPGGLSAITVPTLFIVGGQDKVVGYDPGVKTLWTEETRAPRWLLTFREGGHSIGMNPAPETMRHRLWDQDWFEDPVWRKDRVIGVELHVITAFLGRVAKGDRVAGSYLDVPQPDSDLGVWPAGPGGPYAAVSPGPPVSTVWKGFQRAHATGLELRFAPAE